MRALTMSGYAAPKGITNAEELKRLQKTIGVAPDGIWGAASQKAYDSYLKRFSEPLTSQYQVGGYSAPGIVRNRSDVKVMQEVLGNVAVDGIWGPETDAAYRMRLALDNAPQTQSGTKAQSTATGLKGLLDSRPVVYNEPPAQTYINVSTLADEETPFIPRHKPQKKRSRSTGTNSSQSTLTEQFLQSEKPLQDYINYVFEEPNQSLSGRKAAVDEFYNNFLPAYKERLSATTNYVLPEWNNVPPKMKDYVAVPENPVMAFEPDRYSSDRDEVLGVYLAIENGETPMITSRAPASYRPRFGKMPDGQYGTFSCSPYYERNGQYYVGVYMNGEYLKSICVGDRIPYDVEINVEKSGVSTYLGDLAKNYLYEMVPQMVISLLTNSALGYAGMSEYDIERLNNVMELYDMPQFEQTFWEVQYKSDYDIFVSFKVYNNQHSPGKDGEGFGIK